MNILNEARSTRVIAAELLSCRCGGNSLPSPLIDCKACKILIDADQIDVLEVAPEDITPTAGGHSGTGNHPLPFSPHFSKASFLSHSSSYTSCTHQVKRPASSSYIQLHDESSLPEPPGWTETHGAPYRCITLEAHDHVISGWTSLPAAAHTALNLLLNMRWEDNST